MDKFPLSGNKSTGSPGNLRKHITRVHIVSDPSNSVSRDRPWTNGLPNAKSGRSAKNPVSYASEDSDGQPAAEFGTPTNKVAVKKIRDAEKEREKIANITKSL